MAALRVQWWITKADEEHSLVNFIKIDSILDTKLSPSPPIERLRGCDEIAFSCSTSRGGVHDPRNYSTTIAWLPTDETMDLGRWC